MPGVGIVGLGHVGRITQRYFPDAFIYDIDPAITSVSRREIATCDFVFICVPTPRLPDGSGSYSEVEEVLSWLKGTTCVIRSTVPPGTSDELMRRLKIDLLVWPEYVGEWDYADRSSLAEQGFPAMLIGGPPVLRRQLVELLAPRLGAETRFLQASATEVEVAKYMENAWLAMQAIFANDFFELCECLDIDYWTVRELWGSDPRVSLTHTAVKRNERGFGGRCLPKDLDALLAAARAHGAAMPLVEQVAESNRVLRAAQNSRCPG
jgi:UDPglucose 6-dehydrogenase